MSPLERLSRIAAQLAPLETTELIPYFLKNPFSWAMTMGEQSVSAMMPNLRFAISGASEAYAVPTHPVGRFPNSAPRPPAAQAERFRNFLRVRVSANGGRLCEFCFVISGVCADELFCQGEKV